MKVLFDTNVVLDALLERKPFADVALRLFAKVERGEITGYLGATTITTIYYLAAKALSSSDATTHLRNLLLLFEVAPVNRLVIQQALNAGFSDFEDAVLSLAAVQIGADAIVTRNGRDFKKSTLPVYVPEELLAALYVLAEGEETQNG